MNDADDVVVFIRRTLATVMIAGVFTLAGCTPEGYESAPKMKGSKDEIQKSLAPPATKGVRTPGHTGSRRGRG